MLYTDQFAEFFKVLEPGNPVIFKVDGKKYIFLDEHCFNTETGEFTVTLREDPRK